MNISTISQENVSLLVFLLNTERSIHTLHILRSVCPEVDVDESLVSLIAQGYVCATDKAFELTDEGIRFAQQMQEDSFFPAPPSPSPFSPEEALQLGLPTATAHPLRKRLARSHNGRSTEHRIINFLLAFETMGNALPIPVFDGDILGRLSEANITLSHDDFISGLHCGFKIESPNHQPTLYVQDLDSRNGTYLDEVQLDPNQWYELARGQRLRVGTTSLIIAQIPR